MTPSLEGWPTKAKEAPSPHEVRLTRWTPTQYFNVSKNLNILFHQDVYHDLGCQMLFVNYHSSYFSWLKTL